MENVVSRLDTRLVARPPVGSYLRRAFIHTVTALATDKFNSCREPTTSSRECARVLHLHRSGDLQLINQVGRGPPCRANPAIPAIPRTRAPRRRGASYRPPPDRRRSGKQPDVGIARRKQGRVECCGRRLELPLPADHADLGLDRTRPDRDRPDRLLGTEGLRHYGRPAGRNPADADLLTDASRDLVRRTGESGLMRRSSPALSERPDRRTEHDHQLSCEWSTYVSWISQVRASKGARDRACRVAYSFEIFSRASD